MTGLTSEQIRFLKEHKLYQNAHYLYLLLGIVLSKFQFW